VLLYKEKQNVSKYKKKHHKIVIVLTKTMEPNMFQKRI